MPLSEVELFEVFASIRVWERDGQRAPHKPLLVLLMLGRLWRQEPPIVPFAQIEPVLRRLLEQFGPASARATVHYPFWHLHTETNGGLWDLHGPDSILSRPAGATPNLTEMRESVSGGFAPQVLDALQREPGLIPRLAQSIVAAHFPESLQQDVLEAVGLPVILGQQQVAGEQERRRDASFRRRVLLAYEYRCCVCGHDLRLEGIVVGLDAAHIKWFQAGGPDIEPNGLALCSLHHKLFDLGAFTVLPAGYILVVSQHLTGSDHAKDRLLSYHGAGLIRPQTDASLPKAEYLDWHTKQVFKTPQRE
jgi:putative restriction endonuclease